MQYLDLVRLAEWKCKALSGRKYAPAGEPRMPAVGAHQDEAGVPPDDDSAFFTDGPYIETKEYTGAGRDS